MIKKYTYYRGDFSSQFSFPEEIKPNTSYSKGSKGKFFGLLIEEKKELVNAVPISKGEYDNATLCGRDSLKCECEIHNKGESFLFKQSKQKQIRAEKLVWEFISHNIRGWWD